GSAYNGKECVELVEAKQPDVLILDMIMPLLDGLGVMDALRANEHMTKMPQVIMLTAFGQEEVMRQAVEYGTSYFVVKPFDFKNLLDKIKQISGREQQEKTSPPNISSQETRK